jgi:HAAS domain-containing protein
MTNSTQVRDERIEIYLASLDGALGGMRREERNEILREIRTHILDSLGDNSHDAIEPVLRALGTPERLAEHYRTEFLLTQASHSFSPWLLFRTTWHWAKTGLRGCVVFFIALFGYGTAFTLAISVLLKPFVPRVGLWVGSRTFEFGTPSSSRGLHEVLGNWYVPVATLLAFGAAVGTTHALRWLIRTRTPRTY